MLDMQRQQRQQQQQRQQEQAQQQQQQMQHSSHANRVLGFSSSEEAPGQAAQQPQAEQQTATVPVTDPLKVHRGQLRRQSSIQADAEAEAEADAADPLLQLLLLGDDP